MIVSIVGVYCYARTGPREPNPSSRDRTESTNDDDRRAGSTRVSGLPDIKIAIYLYAV